MKFSAEELARLQTESEERHRRVQWLHDLLPDLVWLITYSGKVLVRAQEA